MWQLCYAKVKTLSDSHVSAEHFVCGSFAMLKLKLCQIEQKGQSSYHLL